MAIKSLLPDVTIVGANKNDGQPRVSNVEDGPSQEDVRTTFGRGETDP